MQTNITHLTPQAQDSDILSLLRADMTAVKLDHLSVTLPSIESVSRLARGQQFAFENSKRLTTKSDAVHWHARIAMACVLGQSPDALYRQWAKALGCGNGGVCWTIDGAKFGLKATQGTNPVFRIWKNPRLMSLDAFVFARVHERKNTPVRVELLGWVPLAMLKQLWADEGRYYKLNAHDLKLVLRPIEGLIQRVNPEKEGVAV